MYCATTNPAPQDHHGGALWLAGAARGRVFGAGARHRCASVLLFRVCHVTRLRSLLWLTFGVLCGRVPGAGARHRCACCARFYGQRCLALAETPSSYCPTPLHQPTLAEYACYAIPSSGSSWSCSPCLNSLAFPALSNVQSMRAMPSPAAAAALHLQLPRSSSASRCV